jgi:transposase InsO family protein
MVNWNMIYAHKWPDELYDMTVTYLKCRTLPTLPLWVRRTFMKRINAGYTLNEADELVLVVPDVPWAVNRTNHKPIAMTPVGSKTFKVVKESKRVDVLVHLMNDPKNLILNAHMLFDKVIRSYHIGISRRFIHTFLTSHPSMRDLLIHRAIPKKTIIKSFRPEYPFQHWQMDLIDMSTVSSANKGYNWIFVIIDIFSKFVYLYPLGQKTGANIAILLSKLFLSGDIPDILHSDNGMEFKNNEVSQVCDEFHVRQVFGKGYSPQTQGFVENKNKHLKSLLNYFFIKHNSYQYYDLLDRFAYNINNAKHSVTGYTPIQLHRGRDVSVGGGAQTEANATETETEYVVEENDQAKLERYYEHSHRMYNERVNHVSHILKSEAVKREVKYENNIQSQRATVGIRVGSYVRVATYMDTGNHSIQPVIIKIDDTNQINPLVIKQEGVYVHVDDVMERPRTVFRKLDLKTRKFYPNIFKVTHVIRELGRVRTTYKLVEVEEYNQREVTSKTVSMLLATGKGDTMWETDFQTPILALYNPYDSASVAAAPRPQYRFVDTMDMRTNSNSGSDSNSNTRKNKQSTIITINTKPNETNNKEVSFQSPTDVLLEPGPGSELEQKNKLKKKNKSTIVVTTELIKRVLSRRACMVREYVLYTFPEINPEDDEYTGGVWIDRGQIIKWDKSSWQVRLSHQRKTGEATRLLLRPEMYGKMNTIDGWTFEQENIVLRKCKK